MTTTEPRVTKQPVRAHSEFAHGPVAAAINAPVVALFAATVGKIVGLPPWVAAVIAVVMTACLVGAGRHRRPRPLSTVSIVYRASAMLAGCGWLFFQLADFPDAAGAGAGLTATVVALLLLPLGFVGMRWIEGPWKVVSPLFAVAVASGLVVAFGPDLWQWIVQVLTTTDRLPCCGGHGRDILSWLGWAALSLAVVTAPTAVLGVTFANREQAADERLEQGRRAMQSNTLAVRARGMQTLMCNQFNEWTDVKDATGRPSGQRLPNLKITDWDTWSNGAGEYYILDLRHSQRGTLASTVNTAKDALATKLDLPQGCGIEVMRAPDKGRGYIRVEVSRVDTIAARYDYPECTMRSIMAPLPVGVVRNGDEVGVLLREQSVFLWGQKGSGKTVCIYCLIAGGLQCTDCLVWVIDLNGGAAAAPFLAGFESGKVDRPCIDWVATTIAEVRRMATVGEAIAVDRKLYYRDLKKRFNTNLMPLGNGAPGQPPPGILIIIDEGAEVLGIGGAKMTDEARAARDALDAIMRLARDAGVNIVFSGLRATSDVADPAFKAGTSVRIGMRVTDAQELSYGFGDWTLDPADIPHQGSGFICCGHEDTAKVFKGYFLDPNRMELIGIETTPWRPYLDARGVTVGGDLYADRWRRTAHTIFPSPRPGVIEYGGLSRAGGAATAVLDRDVAPVSDSVAASAVTPPSPDGGDSFEAMMESASRHRQFEPDTPPGGGPPPGGDDDVPDFGERLSQQEYDQRFAELAGQLSQPSDDPKTWTDVPVPPDAEIAAVDKKVDSRAVLENLVRHAGPAGIKWTKMFHALRRGGDWGPPVPISEVAMAKLLKKPGTKQPAPWIAPHDDGAPYVHVENYQTPNP